jgi:hypothetical protein
VCPAAQNANAASAMTRSGRGFRKEMDFEQLDDRVNKVRMMVE